MLNRRYALILLSAVKAEHSAFYVEHGFSHIKEAFT